MQIHAAFFCLDSGLIESTNTEWMQGDFDTLTVLFDRMGLQEKVRNMVGILYRPCTAVGTQSEETYENWMMREVLTHLFHQRMRLQCKDCGSDLGEGLLAA